MKAIGINGSPRQKGNTYRLLQTVFTPLRESGIDTEIISIGGSVVRGCLACYQCSANKNRQCIIDTDIVNPILRKVFDADILVLASPTYFADVTSEMKGFIDRLGYVSNANGRLLEKKIGTSVVAVRRGGSIHAFDTMQHFLHIQGMISIGSTYWNMGMGRNIGEVELDQEGMKNMENLGTNIVWLCKKLYSEKK